ncbi:MAG: HD-GYP domain-containing protein [Syntrophomonadaceae bacterium]|jgi:HD-GYP domain-containing protein (c-di-GMP phosphodiesterase class II)|nr:HD-GYP domain-containing protein [Thermoanaerobacterales bacterium]NLN21077.1 HD-GYP domain-containing protein [Syntrophomonadaceae bacterium]
MNNKATILFIMFASAVIAVLVYLTVKIYLQAVQLVLPTADIFRYFILAGGAVLVLIAFLWMFYLFISYKGRYLSLCRVNSELKDILINAKDEANRIYFAALNALTAVMQARDDTSLQHLERVANYAVALGKRLDMSQEDLVDLYCAALLHDLGKIGIPEDILKKPGALTREEFAKVRKHPEIGTKILETLIASEKISSIILHHHEFYNGTGYPSGLAREEIPLGARIIAIADAYDAMISDRPYSRAKTHDEAVTELIRCAGVQFDPRLIVHFLDIVEQEDDGVYTLTNESFFHVPPSCIVN